MRVNFLGTGSGKTSLIRFHSSLLISSKNHNLLVDCGDGISSAILKQNISFNSIDSILISHLHADHYSGLASLITQMKLSQRKVPLSVYIHKSLIGYVEEYLLHSYLFKDRINFKFDLIPFEEEKQIETTESLSFVSKLNSHLTKYRGYDSLNKLSFVSLSFLFKDKEGSAIYTGDIGSKDDLYLFNDKVDWFITEISHINLDELIAFSEKKASQQIILTHIDEDSEKSIQSYLNSSQNEQKKSIYLAYDGFILHHKY